MFINFNPIAGLMCISSLIYSGIDALASKVQSIFQEFIKEKKVSQPSVPSQAQTTITKTLDDYLTPPKHQKVKGALNSKAEYLRKNPTSLENVARALYVNGIYGIGRSVGKGGCGSVYHVTKGANGIVHGGKNQKQYVIKFLNQPQPFSTNKGEGVVFGFERHQKIQRPHALVLENSVGEITYLKETDPLPKETDLKIIAILSRAQSEKSLYGLMKETEFTKEMIRGYGKNIALGIANLHKKGIIHRDIKPLNILLPNKTDNDPYRVKIADFDLATIDEDESKGTLFYSNAPGAPSGMKNDWFAFGRSLYEMATQNYEQATYDKAYDLTKVRNLDPDLHDLLFNKDKGLLSKPHANVSEEEILAHPFFASN